MNSIPVDIIMQAKTSESTQLVSVFFVSLYGIFVKGYNGFIVFNLVGLQFVGHGT